MKTLGHHASPLARAAFWLACLGVAVRVLIPQGFMIAPFEVGAPTAIVLCSGHGAVTAFVDASGRLVETPSPPTEPRDKSRGSPCVFSGAPMAWFPGAPADLPADATEFDRSARPIPADLSPGLGLSAPPPPQTGPPRTT